MITEHYDLRRDEKYCSPTTFLVSNNRSSFFRTIEGPFENIRKMNTLAHKHPKSRQFLQYNYYNPSAGKRKRKRKENGNERFLS